MIAIVRDGRSHSAMVGRATRLTQEEIEGLVDFIRAAFMPPEPGTMLAQGRDVYRKSCAMCHGDRGQGGAARGPVGASPALSAALARPGLDDEAMFEAISREHHLPGRMVRGLALSEEEARAVVRYMRAAFIESKAGRPAARPPKSG